MNWKLDNNYLFAKWKSNWCLFDLFNKIVKPNYCTVGIWGFGDKK